MKNVCLLIYAVAVQVFCVRGICLTWNATQDNIFLKCQVLSHVGIESQINLMDSNDQIRVNCLVNGSLYCVTKEEGDIVFGEVSNSEFELVLQTTKKNANGDWKCFHGGEKANTHIDVSKDFVYSADIHISGEIRGHNNITLTCYSCLVPDTKSAYFFVNNVLEDVVHFHDGKCYQKRKLCSQTECTCSTKGNYFTWGFTSNSPYLEFSCEMRFKNEETSHTSIHTANLYYNESDFHHKMKTIRNIQASDMDIYIDGGTDNENNIYLGIVTLILTVSANLIIIGIAFGCTLLCKNMKNTVLGCLNRLWGGNMMAKGESGILLHPLPSTSPFTEDRNCHTCSGTSVCAICIDCRITYCDICCNAHTKYYREHRVCEIEHVVRNTKEIVCDTCLKKKADRLCKICWSHRCESCATYHIHSRKYSLKIYQVPPIVNLQKNKTNIENLEYLYNISLNKEETADPLRICGLSYIDDGRIVIVDSNNRKLIVFKVGEGQLVLRLNDEPRSMTAVSGNQVAITFAYSMEIRIYRIFEKTITDCPEIINLPSLLLKNLKPFSIAFDKGLFAVEMGEGDDGRVVILDNTKLYTTIFNHNHYAFFTGNTIRLALEVETHEPLEGRIFVSAMSKKTVSCVDFKGNKLWMAPVPSPRGLIVVPDCILGTNMVLCSKRCDVIFGFNKINGTDEVLLAKNRIKSPRFVAYNSSDRLLCIQVANKNREDELTVFRLSSTEPTSSDKLLDAYVLV